MKKFLKKKPRLVATELDSHMLHDYMYRVRMFIFASIDRVYSKYGSSVDNIPVYAVPLGGSILKI